MKKLLATPLLLACVVGVVRAAPVPEPKPAAVSVADRSKPVRVALEKALNKKAEDITAADLATVTELKLPHIHIPSFKENDFAGLTHLKKLHFYSLLHNNGEPTAPIAINGKVFAKLSSLEELIMDEGLGLLPDDVFAGLTGLKILDLSGAELRRLPTSLLNLPKIEAVYFDGEGLSEGDYATLKTKLGDKLHAVREKK